MSETPITVEEARERIAAVVPRLSSERLELDDCLGRVATEDVHASDAVPPFDNSAMDGYAVRAEDLEGATASAPVRLEVIAESRAGSPASRGPGSGEAVAISTGAVLPAGADAVVPTERVSEERAEAVAGTPGTSGRDGLPAAIEASERTEPGAFVRRTGDDVQPGDLVIAAGSRLGPAELGSLASIGVAEAPCARRPRLALLTTGDELVPPNRELGPGQIRETSRYSIAAMSRLSGAEVAMREGVADSGEATLDALGRALSHDIVVVCGGVSVGRHDHVKDSLDRLGVEQIFWRVAMRPGGPTWFGASRAGTGSPALIFGLPGNPVSALVTFQLFVRYAIALSMGADPEPRRLGARLGADRESPLGRSEYLRCRLEDRPEGLTAIPTRPEQSSHVLTSVIGSEGLAVLPPDRDHLQAGEAVTIELLCPVG